MHANAQSHSWSGRVRLKAAHREGANKCLATALRRHPAGVRADSSLQVADGRPGRSTAGPARDGADGLRPPLHAAHVVPQERGLLRTLAQHSQRLVVMTWYGRHSLSCRVRHRPRAR